MPAQWKQSGGLTCVMEAACMALSVIKSVNGLMAVVIKMCILLYDSFMGISWILIKISYAFSVINCIFIFNKRAFSIFI